MLALDGQLYSDIGNLTISVPAFLVKRHLFEMEEILVLPSSPKEAMHIMGVITYCSVIMYKEEKIVLDYSSDRMINDRAFQVALLSRIAEAGKIIEGLYGSPQDIEGVVKNGLIYVRSSVKATNLDSAIAGYVPFLTTYRIQCMFCSERKNNRDIFLYYRIQSNCCKGL